jgi:ribonuclease-3
LQPVTIVLTVRYAYRFFVKVPRRVNGSSPGAAAVAWLRRALGLDRRTPSGVERTAVEAVLGMPLRDLGLFEHALRHRSIFRGAITTGTESNERLEFLGDAVLGAVVAEKLYTAFPDRDEGFLTRLRANLVNGQALARYARALGLGQLILMSENAAQGEGRDNPTILADAFEAVIGALYLDQGFLAARAFVLGVLEREVDLDAVAEERSNYKSLLLELAQSRGWGQPVYAVVEEEGPSHDRRFTIEVLVEDVPRGRGAARSKKQAEQEAAHEALEALRREEAAPAGAAR